ncbi:hypothetical protein [Azospirillum largimobile]
MRGADLVSTGFQPIAPLIPTLLPQGEKGYSQPKAAVLSQMRDMCTP